MPKLFCDFRVGLFEVAKGGRLVQPSAGGRGQLFQMALACIQGRQTQSKIVDAKLVERTAESEPRAIRQAPPVFWLSRSGCY